MKIVFDARWIYEKPSGIGVYTEEIAARVAKILPGSEFTFLFNSRELAKSVMERTGLIELPNITYIVLPYGPLSLKNQIKLTRLLRRLKPDYYHNTNYMIPYPAFLSKSKRVTKCISTIHDVIPLVVDDYAPNSRTSRMKSVFRFCLKQAVLRSDTVVTVSNFSKNDILKSLRLPEECASKIRVIYNSASENFSAEEYLPVKRDSVTPRQLLYVGRMDPYKNVTGLIESFASAAKRLPFPVKLVIAGPKDERYPEAPALAQKLGVADDVRFTGFVRDEELYALYRNSDLLVHPSKYEGFGLQLIEAMRSGLPVCCTDGGSQPEVAGDAARIVKAGDDNEMADAIAELLSNPDKLESMRNAGFMRAKKFSWDKTAEAICALYN